MPNTGLRYGAGFCHFMVFASSVIVTGIVSYFLSKYTFRGSHLVYQEVIAVCTIPIYFIATICPIFKDYEGYLWPINLIFSYLWLTSFILSASDLTGRLCSETSLGNDRCSLKRAVEAFDFIAFFFLFINIFVEGTLMRECHRQRRESEQVVVTKDRPGTSGTHGTGQTDYSSVPVAPAVRSDGGPQV